VTPQRRKPRRRVDHRYIAELCARHQSGDYVMAANRFCQHQQLGALDKLRIHRLAAQQVGIQAAIDRTKNRGS